MIVDDEKPSPVISLDERDRKAELALIMEMENLKNAGAKRQFAASIGLEWDEWLRIQRKYKRVIEAYRRKNDLLR
jgi:hypothetical protein